jgi:hypothetical protein
MICVECRKAGKFLTAQVDTEEVAWMHAQCKGGTWCDCQHVTQPVVKARVELC